jgi:hypothetical protein
MIDIRTLKIGVMITFIYVIKRKKDFHFLFYEGTGFQLSWVISVRQEVDIPDIDPSKTFFPTNI